MPISVLSAASAIRRAAATNRNFYLPLRPVLIGPRAGLHRFDVSAEKALLGDYDPLADQDFDYPGKADASTVDLDSLKIYADDARLNYFNKYIGISGTCQPSADFPNRVRCSAFIFKTGNDFDRSAVFYDRDVKIGDVAVVRQGATIVTTTVTGFVGDPVAAVTAAANPDSNNKITQVASSSITQVAGTPINDVVGATDHTNYESTDDGYITRTYTVTVTQSSTGGNATTGLLRVRSADGLDNLDDVVPSAFGAATNVGTKGLKVTWSIDAAHSSSSLYGIDEDDFVVGQQWTIPVSQAFTAPVATSSGTYTGTRDDNYIVTVTRGGKYVAATKPQITVTTANGSDSSGPTTVTAASTTFAVGTHAVLISFSATASLRKGDVYYVTVTGEAEGEIRTIITRDDIPEALRGTEVDLRLFADRSGILIPKNRTLPGTAANWSATASQVTLEAGVYLTDSEFTDGGDLVGIPLDSATLYLQYREWLIDGAGTVVVLNDPDTIEAELGPIDVTNPIAQAAALALANTAGVLIADPNSSTATTTDEVMCVALGGDPADLTLWTDAFHALEEEDLAYNLVVLSTEDDVRNAAVAHVTAQSADDQGFYRNVWLAANLNETGAVVDEATSTNLAVVTATITADPDTGDFTVVTASANAGFVTTGVRAGDSFRINYGTDADGNETYDAYTIGEAVSNTTLNLESGPTGAVSPARQAEVWRTYTKTELAAQLTAKAASYADQRVRYVWPDRAAFGGVTYEGYLVCSAVVGLAGSVPSHQGLRNVGVEGFDDMTRSSRFFGSGYLKTLRDGGVFVVNQSPAGGIFIFSASTTDIASTDVREEMIVRNADMVRKAIQGAWAPYVGSGNVSSGINTLLASALTRLSLLLKSGNWAQELGAPIGDLSLDSMISVTGAPDTVEVTVTVAGLPVPLNKLRIILRI